MNRLTFAAVTLLLSIMALALMGFVRPVEAEDDCAVDTWVVTRTGPVLWCIGEGWVKRNSAVAVKGDRLPRRVQ